MPSCAMRQRKISLGLGRWWGGLTVSSGSGQVTAQIQSSCTGGTGHQGTCRRDQALNSTQSGVQLHLGEGVDA